MKEIQLTQGQVALVDDHWFDFLSQWKWCVRKARGVFYALRSEKQSGIYVTVRMHRVIMNTPPDLECDHINHNTLDNREINLRNVTHAQNHMNVDTRADNLLGHRGITKAGNSYRARLWIDGKRVYDEVFKTVEDAVEKRAQVEKEHFGEFRYMEQTYRPRLVVIPLPS